MDSMKCEKCNFPMEDHDDGYCPCDEWGRYVPPLRVVLNAAAFVEAERLAND